MSFSSGTFSLVAGNPVVTATTIDSTVMNNTLSDIATGLSTCILKDGTQTTTASVPFAFGLSCAAGSTFTTIGASDTITSTKVGGYITSSASAATSAAYHGLANTGNTTFLGIEGSVGGVILSDSTAYSTVLGTTSARALQLGTNNAVRLSIGSTGAVTIPNLAGVGSRPVVADAAGVLSA